MGPEYTTLDKVKTMLVALQLFIVGGGETTTELVPCVEPKFVPVIATNVPTSPMLGDKLEIPGTGSTV